MAFCWYSQLLNSNEQGGGHTADELTQAFATPGFDQNKFAQGASDVLDGGKVFWDGLWSDHVV